MQDDQFILFQKKPYYLIRSTKTEKPYIDINDGCYLFEAKMEAISFTKNIPDTSIDEARQLTPRFCTDMHSYGIKYIRIKERGEKKSTDIEITKNDIKKQFYNCEANRDILRLLQTSQKKYLRDLKDKLLIIPININVRAKGEYPVVQYCYATYDDPKKKYYILFSTIQEFNKWKEDQKDKGADWKSQGTSINNLKRICDGQDIIINPLSDKLIITNKNILECNGKKRTSHH